MKNFETFPRMPVTVVPKIFLCSILILYNTPNVSGSCNPLFLTPYIQQGNIRAARELSLVDDPEGIIPKSHSGFITVDQEVGNHLFFWFFPTLNCDPSAPLLIWLNGRPGESSTVGLVMENGPIQIGKSNSGETIYKIRNNTWVNQFSMLYIDTPVGFGYSFSDNFEKGQRSTQDLYTRDLYEFIQQFYQMFPEFLERDLYIGGQVYAGRYVPALAFSIHRQNHFCGAYIPLKGIYIGDPVTYSGIPWFQFTDRFHLYAEPGYISYKQLSGYKKHLSSIGQETELFSLLVFNYAVTFGLHPFPNDRDIKAVMTSAKLRSLLHVGNATFVVRNFTRELHIIRDDATVSGVHKLTELMDHYKVLLYSADLDGLSSVSSLEYIIKRRYSSWSAYNATGLLDWRGENGTLKGVYTQVSNFCRVVIHYSGHRTAIDQPENTLEMIEQFVTNGCVS